ncbi:MAG: radical SAM protein [Ruminococcus sp.]|nr:radical SAM protein [Ruminococcus sp.]
MFDIQEYMAEGVERIVSEALKATLSNPRESAFMLSFAAASRRATKLRKKQEAEGMHVPPFLIASITSSCNLHCAGCYARANSICSDEAPAKQLSAEEWGEIFSQAQDMGISFILLAGGEPCLRRDVITAAGGCKNILFPIFTNGTFLDEKYFDLLDRCRNLVPIMSIEGGRETTDARRGSGVYDRLEKNMERLRSEGLIFGASVTVTKENLSEVTDTAFTDSLAKKGCKAVIYVEYVPTDGSSGLAPDDSDRERLASAIEALRKRTDMLYISFPGDEKSSGGCLAAGRGFFHINPSGGAEPCPFSPFSDINVRDVKLSGALQSSLFTLINAGGLLNDDHEGGCVLYEKRREVEALLEVRG